MFLALVIFPLVRKKAYKVFLVTYIAYAVTMIYAI
jgi:hypothetical protein